MDESGVLKFCSITGVSTEEAQHFLEAFGGDVDGAVKAYFEDRDTSLPDLRPSLISQPNLSSSNNIGPTCVSNPEGRKTSTGRIVTLNSIRYEPSGGEEGQAFYVGGSETGGGGQQVLGPPRRDHSNPMPDPTESPDTFVHNIFQAAKGKGAEVLDMTQFSESTKLKKQLPFSGTGHKLGDDSNEEANGKSSPSPQSVVSRSSNHPTEQNVIVKMWRDGFSLDDGPLRFYTDPEAREFFNDVQSGQIPQELLRTSGGKMINLMLEDHHHENWCAPLTPTIKPFSGTGHMLGFPTPKLTQNLTSVVENTPPPQLVKVNDSEPVTQIQVRTPDGSRLVIRLNHHHTIGDIRQAIISQRPDLASSTFNLMSTFPNRELTDDNQTVEEAQLLQSCLMLRLT